MSQKNKKISTSFSGAFFKSKNFFKDPVYNEPPLYDDQPASHPSMPPKRVRKQGFGA